MPTITPVSPRRTASIPAAPSASASSKSTLLASCDAQRCNVLSQCREILRPSEFFSCDRYAAVPTVPQSVQRYRLRRSLSNRKLPSARCIPSLTTTITLFFSTRRALMRREELPHQEGLPVKHKVRGGAADIACKCSGSGEPTGISAHSFNEGNVFCRKHRRRAEFCGHGCYKARGTSETRRVVCAFKVVINGLGTQQPARQCLYLQSSEKAYRYPWESLPPM